MKRIFSFVIVIATLLSVLAITVSSESYWDAQKEYLEALELKDDDRLLKAVERIEAVYPDLVDKTERLRVMFPQKEAAKIYEKRGYFDKAAEYYEKFFSNAKFLTDNNLEDYTDYVNTAGSLFLHNGVVPRVYAETSDKTNIPYYNAKNEPEAGTYHGMCGRFDENFDDALLLYVQFFNETVKSFSWKLPKTTDKYLLTVAWNVPNENLEDLKRIVSGESDEYIISNLEYISTLKADVMLRFGAEVNCWPGLPSTKEEVEMYGQEFIDTFKAAFRRISDMCHKYAPNAAMVYSPNDLSNWYFTHEDFYPGDEYVDWVGMSSYCNLSSNASNNLSNGTDAYYHRGVYYEDQILKIKSIVDAYSDRKPIMITECGFCYKDDSSNQTEEHAFQAMKHFYTYVNMVYPQIKAIMYFNTNFGGEYFKLFGDDNYNATLAELYRKLTTANPAMQYSMGKSDKLGYTDITNINESTDALNLHVYASYPTTEPIKVEYSLDSKAKYATEEEPYSYSIDANELSVGKHLLSVKVTCMNTYNNFLYVVEKTRGGKIKVEKAIPDNITDIDDSHWAYEYVGYCMGTGLFAGISETEFAPSISMNRAMFVTIMGRLCGIDPDEYSETSFDDVKAGEWYAPYVAWAKEAGIVTGVSEKLFEPLSLITREQMCVILVRYADKFGISLNALPDASDDDIFADDADISDYARESVYTAKNAGLVNGKQGNMFEPFATATRAEAAAIFMRFSLLIK